MSNDTEMPNRGLAETCGGEHDGRVVVVALVACAAIELALLLPPSAACAAATTKTFTTPGEATFVVPAGITSLSVEAVGVREAAGSSTPAKAARGRCDGDQDCDRR